VIGNAFGLVILLSVAGHAMTGQGGPVELVLTGGTIYATPMEDPIANGVVVLRDGRIADVGRQGSVVIPEAARRLDCSGLTVTAGFWNSHVHFMERKWADAANVPAPELAVQLEAMLTRYGFTSVFDTGSPWENTRRIRERIESGDVPGPRIRSTGEGLLGKGWLPPDVVLRTLGVMLFPLPEVTDAADARAAAAKILEGSTDGLKLFAAAQFPRGGGRAARTGSLGTDVRRGDVERISRGEIWLVDPIGFPKPRPALVLSINALNDLRPEVLLVPITTKEGPLHVGLTEDTATTGLKEKSFAECEPVGPVLKSRLKKRIGMVKPRDLAEVGSGVKRVLGL
jgi:mRNA-degrading endonuclease toxin of MazEF toxin-antitoxin module